MEERRTHEAANGTINRELAVLGRMLRLAYENGKLVRMPVIRKLSEAGQLTIRLAYNLFTQKPKGEKADFLNWTATSREFWLPKVSTTTKPAPWSKPGGIPGLRKAAACCTSFPRRS